jgi:methylglutaconyl-CoA hydratase
MIEISHTGPIATVTLNRPDSHNAFTPEMIQEIRDAFLSLGGRSDVRIIILTGNGRSFCAGADVNYMRETADYTFDENLADGQAIFDLMHAVDSCPKVVVGRINGAAIGGGAGLTACCDIAVAVERARFAFSEVRLGIVPAVISPFVVAKIGVANSRELFLTGERFIAQKAREIGLVQHIAVDETALDAAVQERIEQLLMAAPGAQADAKMLIRTVANRPKSDMRDYTSNLIAQRRAGEEGREGMSAFLEKRRPNWQE